MVGAYDWPPLRGKILDFHSSSTLINDVIYFALKVYLSTLNPFVSSFLRFIISSFSPFRRLTCTELMMRLAWTDQQVVELGTEVDNWKEQFKSLQLEKDVLAVARKL